MKKILLPLLISCSIMPSITWADIKISAGSGVNILAVNGKAIDQGTLFSKSTDITAENGSSQIVAEYTAEIKHSADDYTLEKSDTFVISFTANDTIVSVNSSSAKAAMASLNTESHSFNTGTPAQPVSNGIHADQKMVGQMLQFWYEQAGTETRNKFKSWIESSH
jgi:uncharacterized protein YccT (UPF0319 family)